MKKYVISLFLVLLSFSSANAELSELVNLESRIEARVLALVQQIDSDAQVFVKVDLQKINVNLPATSFDYFGVTSVENINTVDVKSIKIQILSSLEPFPEWLKVSVQAATKFSDVTTIVDIQKYDPEMLEQIYRNQPAKQFFKHISEKLNIFATNSIWITGLLFAVVMGILVSMVYWISSILSKQTGRLVSAVESTEGGGASLSQIGQEQTKTESVDTNVNSQNELELPLEGLIELLADCYWTHSDAYAHWLWQQLKPKQRQELLETWQPMVAYAEHLQSFKVEVLNHHRHPYYLRPLDLKNFSQESLEKVATSNHALWNMLSPLRQMNLIIPLELKIKMLGAKNIDRKKLPLPKTDSGLREFDANANFGEISLEDELAIWTNDSLVPEKMRSNIITLVWLAKLEDEACKNLLSQYSAIDLARCWIGPEEVLVKLQAFIAPKKWKLIESYRQTVTASRRSEAFKRLSRAATEMLLANKEVVDEISIAS